MKSFSSFSFNDIALDKNLDEIPGDLGSISYRYSDPCMLDRSDRDDTEEVVRDDDFSEQVNPFRSSESSVIETGNKHHHNISQVHSRSIDSWLENYFDQEQRRQKTNLRRKLKQHEEPLEKGCTVMDDKKKKKRMGKIDKGDD